MLHKVYIFLQNVKHGFYTLIINNLRNVRFIISRFSKIFFVKLCYGYKIWVIFVTEKINYPTSD